VNAWLPSPARDYGGPMWPTKVNEDATLLDLFQASGRNVQRASCLLRDLFADFPEHPEVAAEIRDCEHRGDEIAHDILSRLAERGSDFDAADIHALTGALDDIVDHAEEAADQLGLYRVEAPMEQAEAMTVVLVGAADQVAHALHALREGDDAGPCLGEIRRLEKHADRILREAVASLFAGGIDPMIVIRWKDIFETLESAVDACETVANVLEGIALKRANGRP
jgi:uncharacterized protein Yka (UPF0111/DUF47 family)